MEIHEFLAKHITHSWVAFQLGQPLHSLEIDQVRTVERSRHAIDFVCGRFATAEIGMVFNVVDTVRINRVKIGDL